MDKAFDGNGRMRSKRSESSNSALQAEPDWLAEAGQPGSGRARDRLADTFASLVELDHGKLVGRGRIGRDRLVEGALGFLARVELADQVGAGKE